MRRSLTFALAATIGLAAFTFGAAILVSGPAPHTSSLDPYHPDPRVDIQHYTFRLGLSDENDNIEGNATVELLVTADSVASVTLNLVERNSEGRGMTVASVSGGPMSGAVDGPMTNDDVDTGGDPSARDLEFTHEGDELNITLPGDDVATSGNRYEINIAYSGTPGDGLIISQNKHGGRTFFGDNWPNRARNWLPSVDHPSDKATVEFIVEAPGHYQVIATGAPVEESDLAGGRRITHSRSVVPIATKVMVIGVARFAVDQVREVNGIPVSSWVYPEDREAGFSDYARAAAILDYFASHIGPYPYSKLANVQSTTRYGGMENAGNIFYSENSISGTGSNEGLLAHEIAHQWFGDSVTEDDWYHVWLSEGFATYFTQLYFEHTYGRDRMNAGLRAQRTAIAAYHDRNPHSPVVDTTITDLNDLLSTNSYQKGGWVLHMLRREVGDENFWSGIRRYYREHRDDNALTSDLRRAMETSSGESLGWFFDQWLHQPGQPEIRATWSPGDGATINITIEQLQEGDPFRFPLDIGFVTSPDVGVENHTLDMTMKRQTFQVELSGAPADAASVVAVLDPDVWLLMRGSISRG
jgi:aminopeptidase N